MKKIIALVFGGRSAEHEVSMVSAKNIFNALDKNIFEPLLVGISKQGSWYLFEDSSVFNKFKSLEDKELENQNLISMMCAQGRPVIYSLKNNNMKNIDAAFPIIHGTMGEDGTLQGFFKIINLPFVGCGVLSSSIGMDKVYMKRLMTEAGIPNSRYLVITKENKLSYNQISQTLGSTFFIKPANAGSSVGVHKIKNENDYNTKIIDSLLYDHKVLAEEFVEGKEVECSVLGLNSLPKASLPGELIVHHEFYSYEAKYIDAHGAEIIIPARLDNQTINLIQNLAIKTFKTLNCDGLSRVDFFVKKNGEIFVNEINTLPGFTQISMYPKMWEASGIKYADLITELINLAFKKHDFDSILKMSFN